MKHPRSNLCMETVEKILKWPEEETERQWVPAGQRSPHSRVPQVFITREYKVVENK